MLHLRSLTKSGTIWSGGSDQIQIMWNSIQADILQGPNSNPRDLQELSKLRKTTWEQLEKGDSSAWGGWMPLRLHLEGEPSLQSSAQRRLFPLCSKVVWAGIYPWKHFSSTLRCSHGAQGSDVPEGLFWKVLRENFVKNPGKMQSHWTWSSDTNTHKGRIHPCAI